MKKIFQISMLVIISILTLLISSAPAHALAVEQASGESGPGNYYVLWVYMPGSGPVSGDFSGLSYDALKYSTLYTELEDKYIVQANVSMAYHESEIDQDSYGIVDITGDLREIQDKGYVYVIIIVGYSPKLYTGDPLFDITYDEGGGGMRFLVNLAMDPQEITMYSWVGYLKAHLTVDGEYGSHDISIQTVRITQIDQRNGDPVFCETDPGKIDIVGDTLSVHFDLQDLRGKLPAGDNVFIRIDGNFSSGERFFCVAGMRVIKLGVLGWVTEQDGGGVTAPGQASITVVPGSVAYDMEISVDAGVRRAGHAWNKTASGQQDLTRRNEAMLYQGLMAVGEGVRFGPAGIVFREQTHVTLYYLNESLSRDEERQLAVYYWNAHNKTWETLQNSSVNPGEKSVTVSISHFSIYQIMRARTEDDDRADDENLLSGPDAYVFKKGEIFCFPNPAKGSVNPTIHVECGTADTVSISIYNTAGEPVYTVEITDLPQEINGTYAYEHTWNTAGVPSGVYIYSVRARRKGYSDIKVIKKLAVIK